jgi:hypothetical protein
MIPSVPQAVLPTPPSDSLVPSGALPAEETPGAVVVTVGGTLKVHEGAALFINGVRQSTTTRVQRQRKEGIDTIATVVMSKSQTHTSS